MTRATQYAPGSNTSMNTGNSTLEALSPATAGSDALSIALIGPEEQRRKEAANALLLCENVEVREFPAYPASLEDVPRLVEQRSDVVMVDIDARPEYALELVEALCAGGSATVMVYSSKPAPDLLMRCMRAGAREFLSPP